MNQEFLKQAIDTLEKISDLLYQNEADYAYKMLGIILAELECVINQIQEENKKQHLMNCLMKTVVAMEEKNYIWMADIIHYEIYECLLNFVEE